MTDLTFLPDGDGGPWCSVCGINAGFTITDPVAHADWHDEYDGKWWRQGWLTRGVKLVNAATVESSDYTPTERAGIRKALERQMAAMEGGAQ